MRLHPALAATLLLLAPAAALAAPGDMNVATYLAKADALKAKGMAAMMSSDIGVLREEVRASGKAYRAGLVAAQAAGKPQRACPPAKMGIKADRLLAHLRGYPRPAAASHHDEGRDGRLDRENLPLPYA